MVYNLVKISYILLLINMVCTLKADAYLDMGSGSYFIQILAATFFGFIFTIKMTWGKIIDFLTSIFSKKQKGKKDSDL